MKDHAQFAEDLALYAMGALDARECPELQAHLGTCGECRRELEALRADLAMVALSTAGPQPPQRSRDRLLNAIAAEARETRQPSRPQLVSARRRPAWLNWLQIMVAVALAILCIGLVFQVQRMKIETARLVQDLADEKARNTTAKAVMDMINNPNVQRMTLVSAAAQPAPHVKTFYQKKDGHILLLATNLESLPADKSYELWLIPMSGGAPMPAGIFRVEPDGSTMMMHTMESIGVDAKAFAITIEPLHGSSTPTMPIRFAPPSG